MALGAPGAYKSFWRPSILDRYLLRMLIAPAGAVLGVTLVAFLLDQTLHLIDQLAANGARLSYLFGLVTDLVPYELGLALPASFFVSMFIVIARLDEESEIDAILSGGVSFERIVAPLVFAGMVLGVVSGRLSAALQLLRLPGPAQRRHRRRLDSPPRSAGVHPGRPRLHHLRRRGRRHRTAPEGRVHPPKDPDRRKRGHRRRWPAEPAQGPEDH
jgi:hypothetical protein